MKHSKRTVQLHYPLKNRSPTRHQQIVQQRHPLGLVYQSPQFRKFFQLYDARPKSTMLAHQIVFVRF